MLERADKLNKEHFDRWEKARERNDEMRMEIKAIAAKVDVLLKIKPDEKNK